MGSKPLASFTKLEKQEKKQLIFSLEDAYATELDKLQNYHFYKTGKEKIYITPINLDKIEIKSINSLGVYFGTFHAPDKFRLSIEGSQMVEPKKNFLVLKNEKALASYLAAENLFDEDIEEINNSTGTPYIIVKYKENKLGCVSVKEGYYLTYMPKSRKLDYNKVY